MFPFELVRGTIRVERGEILLLLPLVLLILILGRWHLARMERQHPAYRELRDWIVPLGRRIRRTVRGLAYWLFIISALGGLSAPQLFFSQSILPLHNAGQVILLDSSFSMLTEEDVFGPEGRFGGSKREIIEEVAPLVKEKVRPRLGLVLFAGRSSRSLFLYDDYGVFLRQVKSASIASINDQGTNYIAALTDALELCDQAKDLIYCGVILITDGDREADVPGLFSSVLPRFQEKQVRLDVIGVGKRAAPLPGVQLPGQDDVAEPLEKKEGGLSPVLVQYDEGFLRAVAESGGGEFFAFGERGVLRKHLKKIRGTLEEAVRQKTKRWTDISEYVFMATAFFLFLYLILSLRWSRKSKMA